MASNTRRREAFDVYWGLGRDRSIVRLQAALEARGWRLSLRTLYSWSSRDAWQNQIAERERQARAAADEAAIDEMRDMYARHASAAMLLQQKGVEALTKLPLKNYNPAAARRAVLDGARLEREARGALAEPHPHPDDSA